MNEGGGEASKSTNPDEKREEIRHGSAVTGNYPVRVRTSVRRARSPYFRLYHGFLLSEEIQRGNEKTERIEKYAYSHICLYARITRMYIRRFYLSSTKVIGY